MKYNNSLSSAIIKRVTLKTLALSTLRLYQVINIEYEETLLILTLFFMILNKTF